MVREVPLPIFEPLVFAVGSKLPHPQEDEPSNANDDVQDTKGGQEEKKPWRKLELWNYGKETKGCQ